MSVDRDGDSKAVLEWAAPLSGREASFGTLVQYSSLLHDMVDSMLDILRADELSVAEKMERVASLLIRSRTDLELQQCFEWGHGWWDADRGVLHGSPHWESVVSRLEALQMRRCWGSLLPGGRDEQDDDSFSIGIDVGGTNTDAVLLRWRHGEVSVVASVKTATTADEMTGVQNALRILLVHNQVQNKVGAVFLGTTQFLNALMTCSGLERVGVVRLCKPTSVKHPPLMEWPEPLRSSVLFGSWMLHGGYEFFPHREIAQLREREILDVASDIAQSPPTQQPSEVVVCGVHAPLRSDQEERACQLLSEALARRGLGHVRISSSCQAAGRRVGLLQRESAAALSASLRGCARRTTAALAAALATAGLSRAQAYLTTTDGTVVDATAGRLRPVECIASGPVNALRGAGMLINDALSSTIFVVDCGGTSIDVGVLVGAGRERHVREAGGARRIAGVRINSRVADVISIALGGGSVFRAHGFGPHSVGHRIRQKALCCGGDTATFTDVALVCLAASGKRVDDAWCSVRGTDLERSVTERTALSIAELQAAYRLALEGVTDAISTLRTSASSEGVRVVLAGGGGSLLDRELMASSLGLDLDAVVSVPHGSVANACGAGRAQVSAEFDDTTEMVSGEEGATVDELRARVMQLAVDRGGVEGSAVVTHEEVTPIAFVDGRTRRVFMKAVADVRTDLMPSHSANAEVDAPEPPQARPPARGRQGAPDMFQPPPRVDRTVDAEGVWTISEYDVHCLAVGCAVLGSGGGGSTALGFLYLRDRVRDGASVRVLPIDCLPERALVVPGAFMGVPSVIDERIHVTGDLLRAASRVLALSGGAAPADAFLMTAEVGGLNGLEMLALQAQTGAFRGVVDGDLISRAFSRLHMQAMTIYGLPVLPAAMCDAHGRVVAIKRKTAPVPLGVCPFVREKFDEDGVLTEASDPWTFEPGAPLSSDAEFLEQELRPHLLYDDNPVLGGLLGGFGMVAGLAYRPMAVSELRRGAMLGTLSLARAIGDAVLSAQQSEASVLSALQSVQPGAALLASGKVESVDARSESTFAGTVVVRTAAQTVDLHFQNEFLLCAVREGEGAGACLAQVPTIITVLDAVSCAPLSTEEVKYGLRVMVLSLPANPRLLTDQALRLVGPRAFPFLPHAAGDAHAASQ